MVNNVQCPKCGSTQLHADKAGFSGKKAVAGAVLTGGLGLLAGTIGSKNVIITCLSCGMQFYPGQGVYDEQALEKATELERSEVDRNLIDVIKRDGMLAAVKAYKDYTGIPLGEAKAYVDQLASKHNVAAPGKAGCAGIVIMGLGVFLYVLFHL